MHPILNLHYSQIESCQLFYADFSTVGISILWIKSTQILTYISIWKFQECKVRVQNMKNYLTFHSPHPIRICFSLGKTTWLDPLRKYGVFIHSCATPWLTYCEHDNQLRSLLCWVLYLPVPYKYRYWETEYQGIWWYRSCQARNQIMFLHQSWVFPFSVFIRAKV